MKCYVGTSGWSYYSFKGIFYPEELKPKEWLKFYSQHFKTVEINATFYRTPRPQTFKKWYHETPADFIFTIKAPKVITHIKRLKEVAEELKVFLKSIAHLGEKARVLLFQLPPSLKYERGLIEQFLELLSEDYRSVIEIRNASFHNEEFADLLRKKGVALCFSDCGGRYPSWYEVITADFLYLRLHGSPELYVSNYTDEELKSLAKLVKSYQVKEAYVYFDNTALGYAVLNAQTFLKFFENS
jgi:uncharacterized protein YecE (DUF72 family)